MRQWSQVRKGWVHITASPWKGSQSQKTSLQGGEEGEAAQVNKPFPEACDCPMSIWGHWANSLRRGGFLIAWSLKQEHQTSQLLGFSAASGFQKAADLRLDMDASCGWELNLGKKTRCLLGGIPRSQRYVRKRKGRCWQGGGERALHKSQCGLAGALLRIYLSFSRESWE